MVMLLDIEENKVPFVMEWLNKFSFVKTQTVAEKKAFLLQETKDSVAAIKDLTQERSVNKTLFAETFGMWAGRDIDIKKMRKERRERRTKYYDNVTM